MLVRLFLVLASAAGAVSAQDADLEAGRDLFLYFCAECHGKDGASVGPIAEMLAIEPPDLTNLAERNQGVFPIKAVAMQIDGRTQNEAHSYMPVFGPSLDSDNSSSVALPDGQTMLVTQRLANLIAYLQSVQDQGN